MESIAAPLPTSIETQADIPAEDDGDSAYGDETASLTTSMTSSVKKYKYENGRRYHAFQDGAYYLPNDEKENDRLDLLHHILTMRCDDRLHFAPIGANPNRILDLGTGTGIWAIEMGDAYPSAEIIGNDLSPIQPSMVPPNVQFEVDDIESPWVHSRSFDYIHGRYLTGAILDWPKLMQQTYKHTTPGGWVEFMDFDTTFYSLDGSYKLDSVTEGWVRDLKGGLDALGRNATPGPMLEGWVRDAGFKEITSIKLPVPLGPWPKNRRLKEIGAGNLSMFLQGLEAMCLRMFIGMGWSEERVEELLKKVRGELLDSRTHILYNVHVVYARKPLE